MEKKKVKEPKKQAEDGQKTIKNIDLYKLRNAILNAKDLAKNKVKYAFFMNSELIASHIKSLDEVNKRSKEYETYLEGLKEIHAKYCKCQDGKPLYYITEERYSFDPEHGKMIFTDEAGKEACQKEIDKYMAENKAVVAEREKQVYDFDQILQDEVSVPIPLVKVALEDLPELDYANSYSDFMGLMLMIKE